MATTTQVTSFKIGGEEAEIQNVRAPGGNVHTSTYGSISQQMETTDGRPSYTEASGQPAPGVPNDPEAQGYPQLASMPPKVQAMVGRIMAMKDNSDGNVEFARKAAKATVCSTIVRSISCAILLALPAAHIAIGSWKLRDCPRERYIPIYLIVAGVFGVIKSLTNIIEMIRDRSKDPNDDENKKASVNPLDGCISLFLFAWFIAGSYWIYHIYKDYQSADPALPKYCDRTLYLYAFWVQTVSYGFMALSVVACCIGCVCCCCCISKAARSGQPQTSPSGP